MDTKEIVKVLVLLFVFGVFTPVLGVLIRGHRKWQRWVFFAMCFMTISGLFKAGEWGLTLAFDEQYRGHARGFHFYFMLVFAGALIVAQFLESPRRFRWLPPGLWLYGLYVAFSVISIVNAPKPLYVLMAFFKCIEAIIVFLAAWNFLRGLEEVRYLLGAFAVTMFWELVAVLKLKYIDHQYQVTGTFEHQNALAMYGSLIGLVFLSVGAGPKQPHSRLYLFAFIASAWVVECTLSRGGLAAFAGGVAAVMLLSLLDKITPRRVLVLGAVSLVGCVGMVFALNTIIGRFNDPFNRDSNETRRMLNVASRLMVEEHPLGVGWNNFGVVINPPWHYGDLIDEYFRKHGDYATVDTNKGIVESHYYLLLSETGFQGLASYLLLVGVFLWYNARAAWFFRGQVYGAISIGIGMGCFSNYLQSFLERVLTQPRNLMLWMILLALTSRIELWRREAVREKRRLRKQAAPLVRWR